MTTKLTSAEVLLERVLSAKGISFSRLPKCLDRRTPDYELRVRGGMIIAEVKQIEFSSAERHARETSREGEPTATIRTPGNKVRKAISDARGQLADASEDGHPTMLVIYDVTCRLHGDGYNVLVGMYGLQTIVLSVPQPYGRGAPSILGQKFGPKRKMTVKTNTSISAIGVIQTPDRDSVTLEVFHNWHARVPLASDLLGSYGIPQYRLSGDPMEGFQDWERCSATVTLPG